MVIIGGRRLEDLATPNTDLIRSRGRHPGNTMLPHNMNPHVRLHLGNMVTAGTIPGDPGVNIPRMGHIPVNLGHMLIEPTLLNKCLRTYTAGMRLVSSVVLLVVMHRVLLRRHKATGIEGADELSALIFDIQYGCHTFVEGSTDPVQVFAPSAPFKIIAFHCIRWLNSRLAPRPRFSTERQSTPPVASQSPTLSRTSTVAL